jgi:hypothetical protein
MTFIEYFTKYEFDKLKCLFSKCHGEDNLGNYIYTTNKLIRFIDFHPAHNIEGFFMCFKSFDLISKQSQEIDIRSKLLKHTFDTNLSMMQLNHEQQKVFHSIIENPQGLHVLTCTLGSGKTFFVKYIT